jgi:toxin YoeB
MKSQLAPQFERDYIYWMDKNPRLLIRIKKNFAGIMAHPFSGLGKPEPLKWRDGEWSRRIDWINRITYKVNKDCVIFLRCRGHYISKTK